PADALDASTEALSSWRQAGDRRGLGDSLRRRCAIFRKLGEGEAALAAARGAVTELEPDGDSLELARAFAVPAQLHMIRAEFAETEKNAARGLDIAAQLHDEALDIHLLTTVGAARASAGDFSGLDMLEEALARAQAAGLDEATGRAWYNLIGHG